MPKCLEQTDGVTVGPSVRTSLRRVLRYGGMCAVAVGLLNFLFQLMLQGLSVQRGVLYEHVARGWNEQWETCAGVEDFLFWFTLTLIAAAYLVLMSLMLGKWRRGVGFAGAVLALVTVGLLVSPFMPYAAYGAFLVVYCGQISVAVIPLERVANADIYHRRFWRHFRLRSFVWLCVSIGLLLYYLLIMGYFVSLDALLRVLLYPIFMVPGRFQSLRVFASPFRVAVPWDDLVYSSLLAAGMAFYHFFCSAYGINQLDYIIDVGRKPIRHREFWWPFKRAAGA